MEATSSAPAGFVWFDPNPQTAFVPQRRRNPSLFTSNSNTPYLDAAAVERIVRAAQGTGRTWRPPADLDREAVLGALVGVWSAYVGREVKRQARKGVSLKALRAEASRAKRLLKFVEAHSNIFRQLNEFEHGRAFLAGVIRLPTAEAAAIESKLLVVRDLAAIWTTQLKGKPTITSPTGSGVSNRISGPFVSFCRAVFRETGLRISDETIRRAKRKRSREAKKRAS